MRHRWMLPSLGLIIIVSITIVGFGFISNQTTTPKHFAEARISGALIAGSLNNFSSESIDALNKIAEKDQAAKYNEALDLTIYELERIRIARLKTMELLGELEKMAVSIPDIPDYEAQSVGIRAISTKISLIDKLLNYNEKTKQLLDILRNKFTSYSPAKFDEETKIIIQTMNEASLEINELNRKYQNLMEEFDRRTR